MRRKAIDILSHSVPFPENPESQTQKKLAKVFTQVALR